MIKAVLFEIILWYYMNQHLIIGYLNVEEDGDSTQFSKRQASEFL